MSEATIKQEILALVRREMRSLQKQTFITQQQHEREILNFAMGSLIKIAEQIHAIRPAEARPGEFIGSVDFGRTEENAIANVMSALPELVGTLRELGRTPIPLNVSHVAIEASLVGRAIRAVHQAGIVL